MATWGRAHTLGPDEDPLIFEHTTCGHDFDATVACSHCEQPVQLEDVTFRRGPGHPAYPAPQSQALAESGRGRGEVSAEPGPTSQDPVV